MSRKGKLPIPIPKGVEVKVAGEDITVKGPKGTLTQKVRKNVTLKVQDESVIVELAGKQKQRSNFQGLYRTLVENMILGVTSGFEKSLEMLGVGYRAAVQGSVLNVEVGCSHPVNLQIPEGIEAKVEKKTKIIITGMDKQKVGQFAADVRAKKPPEPYQGKGIRYKGEYVRQKAGKGASGGKK